MTVGVGRIETVLDAVDPLGAVYAQGLLDHVPRDDEAEQIAGELDALAGLLDEIPEFQLLLTAVLLSRKQRCELVERIFGGRASEPLEGLLLVMAEADRLGLLRAVRQAFRAALARREGKVPVVVTTAVPLDAAQRGRVQEVLRQALGAEPVVCLGVDGDLLGGVVVRIGDRLYDASVRAELGRVQERLARELNLPPWPPARGPAGTPLRMPR